MGADNDQTDRTRSTTMNYTITVKDYLDQNAEGSSNTKTQYQIARAVGETPRQVRIEIRRLCMDGELICSTPHRPAGYYIPAPDDRDQARIDIERLHKQAIRILALWKRKGYNYNRLFPTEQLEMDLGEF